MASNSPNNTPDNSQEEVDPAVTDRLRSNEYRAFGWRCILCNIVALSPLALQMQSEGEHSVYVDIDDCESKWIQCSKCFSTFHLTCLGFTEETVVIPYLCAVFGCAGGSSNVHKH